MDLEMDNAMMVGIAMWVIVAGIMGKMMWQMFSKSGWPIGMLIVVVGLFVLFLLPICVFSAKKWVG